MIAGILGLVLSLAGLVSLWIIKPTVVTYASATIDTLTVSVNTSQDVIGITGEALGATIDSVDALSTMLGTTATTVVETKPVLDQLDTIMSETLPSSLGAATESLVTAQQAAAVMESTIQSLDAFRFLLSGTPMLGDLVGPPGQSYSPEKPLADTLGELAASLEGLPDTFIGMSENLNATDDNLETIQGNLVTMSESVRLISKSLGEYQAMVTQSQSSMDNISAILTNIQQNLPMILNGTAIVLGLLMLWLLAAQVVILSQGLELYRGTAGRMEPTQVEQPEAEVADEEDESKDK